MSRGPRPTLVAIGILFGTLTLAIGGALMIAGSLMTFPPYP